MGDQLSTTDRTKMKAFVISALLGLAAAAPAQVSHVSHVGHGAVVSHGVAAHLPVAHAVHAAPPCPRWPRHCPPRCPPRHCPPSCPPCRCPPRPSCARCPRCPCCPRRPRCPRRPCLPRTRCCCQGGP